MLTKSKIRIITNLYKHFHKDNGNIIHTKINCNSDSFKSNASHMREVVADLRQRTAVVLGGGGVKAVERHRKRNKLLPRERIDRLLDRNSAFLELSTLAANGMYDDSIASAGIITGIGRVSGRTCVIIASDATVKGGTYYFITGKKHLRAQEISRENKLPCIFLADSGGIHLFDQSEIFPDINHFGRIFYNQATLSTGGIPQIGVVMGVCTAGGAYVPAMANQVVIVKKQGTIFLAGPPLVKAATGEDVDPQVLGGADIHATVTGVTDYYAHDEDHALQITRQIVSHLEPDTNNFGERFEDPLYDSEEIYGVIENDPLKPYDVKEIIARIVDGSRFAEFKNKYGKTLICGFAKIYGKQVGILGNNGVLFSESSTKGAQFIGECCQRNIPLLFLQNITGFVVGRQAEQGGIAKDGASLITAVACAKVPKLTLVVGSSYGAGSYGMCGRGFSPRFLFMWPNSRIAVMGGPQAASVLSQVASVGKQWTKQQRDEFEAPIIKKFAKESSPYYSTARLWDDGIIDPKDTRKVLGMSLAAALSNQEKKSI